MKKISIVLLLFLFSLPILAREIEVVPLSIPFEGNDYRQCYGTITINYVRNNNIPKHADDMAACEIKYTYSDSKENIPLIVLKEICSKNECGKDFQYEGVLTKFDNVKYKEIALYLWKSFKGDKEIEMNLTIVDYKKRVFTLPAISYFYKEDESGLLIDMVPERDFDLYYSGEKLMLDIYTYKSGKRLLNNKYIVNKNGYKLVLPE